MQQKKISRRVSSSVQSNKKLQKKISQHIRDIIKQNNSVLSQKINQKINKKAQQIPQKIIQKTKQTHKYLYKKTLINTKFQWLNKYLQSSQLKSLPMKLKPNKCELKVKQSQDKQNRLTGHDWRRNKRSKTQSFDCQIYNEQNILSQQRFNQIHQSHNDSQNTGQIFKQRSLNRKNLSENHFRFKKSKSIQNKRNSSNLSCLHDQHLKRMLLDQRKINKQNQNKFIQIRSKSKQSQDKQNINIGYQIKNQNMALQMKNKNMLLDMKNKKHFKIFIEENTPVKQFLQCTARLNSSNLMIKNKSGYIKNKKRQYIYQSKQQKRQQSQLLKIKRKIQQDITVEPWNLGTIEKQENQQNDLIMNRHR